MNGTVSGEYLLLPTVLQFLIRVLFPIFNNYGTIGEPSRVVEWLYDVLYMSVLSETPQEKVMQCG
jgi:hypothetical protein